MPMIIWCRFSVQIPGDAVVIGLKIQEKKSAKQKHKLKNSINFVVKKSQKNLKIIYLLPILKIIDFANMLVVTQKLVLLSGL